MERESVAMRDYIMTA